MRNRPTTVQRVRLYLGTGGTGTAPEIARALQSNPATVTSALQSLEAAGVVVRLYERETRYGIKSSAVWGMRPDDECGPIKDVALMRRTALETAWAGQRA
jgi:Fe2+ or Zn2+ uptake regulation protein